MEQATIRRLSDVLAERRGQGDYVRISDIVGQEVVITGIAEANAKYGDALLVNMHIGERECWTITSSQAIMEKLVAVADALPLLARFVERRSKEGRVYHDVE